MFKVGDKIQVRKDNSFTGDTGRVFIHNSGYDRYLGYELVVRQCRLSWNNEYLVDFIYEVNGKFDEGTIYVGRCKRITKSKITLNTRKKY